MVDIKEIKKLIRQLRKVKKDTPKKTQARRDINAKIRELQGQLQAKTSQEIITPEKEKLISEIYQYQPYLKTLQGFDLAIYSLKQLQLHIDTLKKR